MSKPVNTKLAEEVMKLMNERLDLTKAMSGEDLVKSEEMLNESLGVVVAISARLSAAYLLNQLRITDNPELINQSAGNLVAMVSVNYDNMLTAELAHLVEKLTAMAEKEMAGPNKPTTH